MTLAIAHRGGSFTEANHGIENTLAAFEHADALGYRHLETDVLCTRDGVAYACHDEHLERLTGVDARLDQLTAAELDELRLAGKQPFVRLEALLQRFPETWFSIDVKADAAVEETCRVIEKLGAQHRVCLGSFEHGRLQRVRARLPGVETAASRREVFQLVLLPRRVLRRGVAYQWLGVPVSRYGLRVVNRRFMRRAHEVGAKVLVWTVDEPDEINELLDLGVDGIFTDRTDVLRDVLIARDQWEEEA